MLRLSPKSYTPVATTPSGTAVEVLPDSTAGYVTSVFLHADSANTGNVYVGGAELTSANGIPLAPGDTFEISVDPARGLEAIKITDLRVLSASDSNSVRVMVLERL
jgi:hypothetical protein